MTTPPRKLVTSTGHNPYEVYLLVLCVVTGLTGLVTGGKSNPNIAHALSSVELYIWYIGLMAGGVISLGGVLGKTLLHLYIERIGLALLAGASLIYTISLSFRSISISVVLVFLFYIATVYRVFQLSTEIKKVRPR